MGLVGDGDQMLFVDAYDTIVQRSLAGLTAPPGSVVFGADRVCSPDVCAGSLARRGDVSLYLNSGTYVGAVRDVRRLLAQAATGTAGAADSDQRVLSMACLTRATAGWALDADGAHFAPLDGVGAAADVFAWTAAAPGSPAHFRRRDTGRAPVVLHGNGRSKAVFRGMTESLRAAAPTLPKADASVSAALDALRSAADANAFGGPRDRKAQPLDVQYTHC